MHPVNTESLMNARFSLGRVGDEKGDCTIAINR